MPFGSHEAAVDFVSRPIASLTLCVAICCVLTSSAILHRGCTSLVAAIACTHHVLRLHIYFTAEMRCNHFRVDLQQNAKSSVVFVENTVDASKFVVVCCIAETLKTHEASKPESYHCTNKYCAVQISVDVDVDVDMWWTHKNGWRRRKDEIARARTCEGGYKSSGAKPRAHTCPFLLLHVSTVVIEC